jgi:hypothetical protein
MLDTVRALALSALVALSATSCSTPPRSADLEGDVAFAEEALLEEDGDTTPVAAAFVGGATFDVALKGTSETFDGSKFPFTGIGTMTIDTGTGVLTFSFLLSNGLTFEGSGLASVTEKNRIFGSVDIGTGTTNVLGLPLGGIEGVVVIDGKAKSDGSSFSVKMIAAVPNRLGPPPAGFVLSKMSAKGVRNATG